ncbi:MAG: hypothetical protein R2787_07165 [Saprospiraceae bacterium]
MNEEKKIYLRKALDWVEKRDYQEVRSVMDGYEAPMSFTSSTSQLEVQPDITALKNGSSKTYIDVAMKSDSPEDTVTRWKLLSTLATMKNGQFFLLIPRGHKAFTSGLVETHGLEAKMVSI